MTTRTTPRTAGRSEERAAARVAATQAVYQHEMEGTAMAVLLHEFHQHRLGATIEDVEYADADVDFFDDLVSGAMARIDEIDRLISSKVTASWSFERLDKPMKALFRAATYELMARNDVAVGTVINEYLDVAHAFYDKREAGFINGVLDAVSKDARG